MPKTKTRARRPASSAPGSESGAGCGDKPGIFKPRFVTGTSGWSYPDWKGAFYPKDVPQRQFLEYYASRFAATELNASFYRLPNDSMINAWLERTPAEFRFCAKLSRLITHQKKLDDPVDALGVFFSRFQPLLKRMGPVLAQLPPSQEFEAGRVEGFLDAFRGATKLPLSVEARHESWFSDKALALFESRNVALVQADSGGRWPETDVVTADFVYLRFHGPQTLYASPYTPQKLGRVATRVAGWLEFGTTVYAFFNNTDGGHAWRNAEKLRELVEKRL